MGNAYSTVAGGFTNVTVHFPTLAGGVGGLFVVVAAPSSLPKRSRDNQSAD